MAITSVNESKPRAIIKKSKRAILWKEVKSYKHIYLMLALPMAFLIIFRYLPMYGILLSWQEFSMKAFREGILQGILGSPWVGWDNFQRMMGEKEFFTAFYNTLYISFLKILFGFPFPILLALMINEMYLPRYRKVLQTVYTFPHFLSWIIVAGICLNLFGDSGAVKKIVVALNGGTNVNWDFLYNRGIFRSFLVATDIWKEAGWGTIIYLASIAGIDPSLYEAATIDGCNRFQKILYVTIPGILSMILIQFLLRVGGVMDGNFDQVFNLYTPAVYSVADTIDTYIYRTTFQRGVALDFGYTTAVGLFKNVINFVLLIGANSLARRFGSDGII